MTQPNTSAIDCMKARIVTYPTPQLVEALIKVDAARQNQLSTTVRH